MTSTKIERSFITFIQFLMLSKQHMIKLGSQQDLTGMQTTMLFLLDRPAPMHNFKRVFNCDASNITGLVDGLEQKELVSRYESLTDRRVKVLELTTEGQAVRADLISRLGREDSPILSKLSPSEIETFVGLLEKITAKED